MQVCQAGSSVPRDPSGPLKVRPRPSLSTQRSGMIEQGRLNSVLWFCNTCVVLLSPSGLGFPLAVGSSVVYASSALSFSSSFQVHARKKNRRGRNGDRTRNAAVPQSCCIDQGHAGATASEWAPLPSNVPFGAGPSASDHLCPSSDEERETRSLPDVFCEAEVHVVGSRHLHLSPLCPDDRSRTTRPVRCTPTRSLTRHPSHHITATHTHTHTTHGIRSVS